MSTTQEYRKTITGDEDSGEYRDHIATVDEKGRRIWVYPKKPSGPLYNARTLVSLILLALFFGGPFITISGRPILLLNFLERKFYIFGIAFWPQDLHLFGLTFITLVVFIVLFTVVFGRLFCGWACPQTVFMEMVFRKIEYWIEGDAAAQRKLNAAPWSAGKLFKKSLKLGIFYAISFVISNAFLAYIIGKDALFRIISEPVTEHLGGFAAMVIFSFVFFGVFAWFREQVCVLICPYGRLQGVLLDQNSVVVHYDFVRGEPRGKGKRNADSKLGDCIDCRQCVVVCPIGIDIRNGTQLECVNCTACIDACNTIMTKVNRPKGLIRYTSYNGIKEGAQRLLTPRMAGYSAVLSTLVILLAVLLATRAPVESTILRIPGVMYQELPDGRLRNLYNIKVVNKTYQVKPIKLRLTQPVGGSITMVSELVVPEDDLQQSAFFVDLPRSLVTGNSVPLEIQVWSDGKLLETVKTAFIGPASN
ncbi:MAG: cytochrome c oxidase accessory protein CcoG [Candidatus Marinimicrobia bacterium]|nr:cytochrome c oxidase accessory protein CcoG [Candidatus Neomarinimicrobiota bacterium]